MRGIIQLLTLITIGVSLFWFGYSLFAGQWTVIRCQLKDRSLLKNRLKQRAASSSPGDPQVCPVCSSPLEKGDLIKTLAFPSISGGQERLMHIRGCINCLEGHFQRSCPVCGNSLNDEGILVARMFERPRRHPHVHVLGCSRCRRLGIM